MTREIIHVGITVSNMDRSINFYKNILGLNFKGAMIMEGKETDLLFATHNCKVKIAYLNGSEHIMSAPIELLEFINPKIDIGKSHLMKTSISEVCFRVENIDEAYNNLLDNNIECLSEPQFFDFSAYGFGKSKALYFKDPDGIILEFIQNIE